MTSIKNEEVDVSSSLAPGSSGDDGVAVCYLCLDGEVDDAGQPLRRDCACRGSDCGFVHLSCLTDYAATKSKQSLDMIGFAMPWQFEAHAHNVHGLIALIEGTEESARRAVAHFEMYLKVCKTIGDDEGIAVAKRNIAIAKSKYEGGNIEEVLETSREVYELYVSKYGEGSELAIEAGKFYAIYLQNANRGDEARELLTKLLATSKRVLGSHHKTTMNIELSLK